VKLAQEVKGIDVLLSSHTHNRLFAAKQVGDTIIIQSGSHGSFLGRLDLAIQDRRVMNYQHALIVVGEDIQPDKEIQSLVDEALAPYREELSQVVGHSSTALNRNTMFESTMDNLLLQSLLEHTGAQLAFSNGWRYGAPVVPGPIILNDLWNIIPDNPPLSMVDLSGEEIHTMLEENMEHTFSHDPYHQMGGYVKRILGLNAYVKVENNIGHRIQELFVQDQPLRGNQVYTAAFVTAQGVPNKYGANRQELDIRAIDALKNYLARNFPVDVSLQGTVIPV
jgi:2',3'-cyclic-nucleotide 2'-phosphodiesterase (5'-nucleotidase family)